MRIAISGTHFMGKSTFIKDFVEKHPEYRSELEPYDKMMDEEMMEFSLEPTIEEFLDQLDYNINQLNKYANEQNIIFDRCPIDFIAYAMCVEAENDIDIEESEISKRFAIVKEVLNHLDIIVFLPMTKEHPVKYDEDNPEFRSAVDKCFKKIYRADVCDIFPKHNHPKIIEIWGDRLARVKKLENFLTTEILKF